MEAFRTHAPSTVKMAFNASATVERVVGPIYVRYPQHPRPLGRRRLDWRCEGCSQPLAAGGRVHASATTLDRGGGRSAPLRLRGSEGDTAVMQDEDLEPLREVRPVPSAVTCRGRAGAVPRPRVLRSRRCVIESVLTPQIAERGCRVQEVPSVSRGGGCEEVHEIGWQDAAVALQVLLRYRFTE